MHCWMMGSIWPVSTPDIQIMLTGAAIFLFFDLAGEHAVECKVGSEPVVGAARVLVVVGADLLGARARADLTFMELL